VGRRAARAYWVRMRATATSSSAMTLKLVRSVTQVHLLELEPSRQP
jgi:hypothetical protein